MNAARPPVVVGVDGSPDAGAAARYGAWEADRRGVPLRLVHALQPPIMYGTSVVAAYDTGEPLTDAQAVLREAADQVRGRYPDLEVTTVITAGTPASVLVDESRTAALVVIGSRGLGRFEQLLAGSVSAQVAMHAYAPVVVLRPPARDGQPSADRMLAEAMAGWQEKYPEVTVRRRAVPSASPLATLIEEGAHAQLVVVGPRGRGGFAGLLLGSVGDGLVRHAHRPVAVVHPHTQMSCHEEAEL
jgi:nucleotide-binding universal stress UspA family protein